MLLDSNIIIYSALEEYLLLRKFIAGISPYASEISRVEVLGYRHLASEIKEYFNELFENFTMVSVSQKVILKAVELRQRKKMSLGDSLIAATALVHRLELVTANAKDFG